MMDDTFEFIEFYAAGPPEIVFKDETHLHIRTFENDLTGYIADSILKGSSPIDALIRI
jgi:hypothetical protein